MPNWPSLAIWCRKSSRLQGRKVNVVVEVDAPDDMLASYGGSEPLRNYCLAQREKTTR